MSRFEEGLARCQELAVIAQKMGEGSEGPAADALEALARFAPAETGAGECVDAAIEALRLVDAKGLLSYTLAFAAEIDLRAGRAEEALERAGHALVAAEVLGRQSLTALARAIQARASFAAGQHERAISQFEEGCRLPHMSARARAALVDTAKVLGLPIPTSIPTQIQTEGE